MSHQRRLFSRARPRPLPGRSVLAVVGLALLVLALGMPSLGPLPSALAAEAPEYGHVAPSAGGIGKVYMGRQIAGVMGWQGASWLDRSEREHEENTRLLVERLGLRPGMVVADIGAGSGYITRRLSAKVGATGVVYAVDVQPEMLRMLETLARQAEFANLRPVLGAVDDVKLAPASLDLAIMVDVYHELEFPYETLASVVRALKPGGRVVFVEYRAEDDNVPILKAHKMSIDQIDREAAVHPLRRVDSIEGLPWQHALVFAKMGEDGHVSGSGGQVAAAEGSPSVIIQIVSIVGASIVLWAFFRQQQGRWGIHQRRYLASNFVGTVVLTVVAWHESQWGFVLVESIWAAVSLRGLIRTNNARRSG